MFRTISFAFLCAFVSQLQANTNYAVLPPYYQTSKEIMAILNSQEVAEKLGSGRPIQSITRNENGYTITARECSLNVTVESLPMKEKMVGPQAFTIKTSELVCNKDAADLEKD